jgi:UDP-N-acetylmuramoyl-L-alanyl-D-glutamate--2,6-diaminopimelate ligase
MAAKMTANLGVDFDRIVEVLEKVTAVTGRLQRITALESEVQVFVDYAHTPDALEKSLLELRNIKAQQGGMLYVVFGCGGDRDPSKRELMGQVACKLADYVVVTDDNPRTENPEKIRLDVLKGAAGAEEVPGRELAIKRTIGKLKKNDILLIAGKGHETYQIIGNRTLFFSDIETAQKMLLLRNK